MSEQTINAWVQVNFRVPKALYAALKAQAEAEDRSMSRVVRRALVQYLERQKRVERNDG